jgi:hypothetical protein
VFNSYFDKIREDEYILMREYCVKNKPQILTAAKDLGSIAAEILIEGFNAHGMPVAEFPQEEDNLLTTHFKSYRRVSAQGGEHPTSSLEVPGLEHPAEVAHSVQPRNMGTIPIEGPTVAPKPTAYESGTTAPADALFRNSALHRTMQPPPLVNHNPDNGCTLQAQWQQAQQYIGSIDSHAANPCIRETDVTSTHGPGVYNGSPFMGQVEAPGFQQLGNGQVAQHLRRTYDNQSWSPNITAQTYPTHQTVVGNLGVPTAFTNDNAPSEYWPNEWFGQFEENFEG